MNIVVDALAVSYQVIGQGKRVVILHGWADQSKTWLPLARELCSGYEVILVDLPGHGGTESPKTAWGLDDYTKFVSAFLRKIDKADTFAFIGHSNGGAIAIRGLASNVLQAEKLVLLASAGVRANAKLRRKALHALSKTAKPVRFLLSPKLNRRISRRLHVAIGSDYMVLPEMQATFRRIIADDVTESASRLNLKTLLLYGQDDTATPPSHGSILHDAIGQSELRIIPAAGHFLQNDQPHEVEQAIKDFLA